MDVVPEFPWTVRLTMKDHEHIRELMSQEKQEKLEAMIAPIRDKGVDVQAKVLHGKTSVAIIREVIREDHDLVLRATRARRVADGDSSATLACDCFANARVPFGWLS